MSYHQIFRYIKIICTSHSRVLCRAMWLRDSTNQVLSYIPFANEDNELKQLILGLIHMQAEFIVKVHS